MRTESECMAAIKVAGMQDHFAKQSRHRLADVDISEIKAHLVALHEEGSKNAATACPSVVAHHTTLLERKLFELGLIPKSKIAQQSENRHRKRLRSMGVVPEDNAPELAAVKDELDKLAPHIRLEWDCRPKIKKFLKLLRQAKPMVVCGGAPDAWGEFLSTIRTDGLLTSQIIFRLEKIADGYVPLGLPK